MVESLRRFLMYITGVAELIQKLDAIERHTARLSDCVNDSQRHYGYKTSISTKHWNDKRNE